MEILIGFCLGLLFNFASLKIRQVKFDQKIFADGLSKGIHIAKMAHTGIRNHPDRDGMYTDLYVRTEFSYPDIEMLKGGE